MRRYADPRRREDDRYLPSFSSSSFASSSSNRDEFEEDDSYDRYDRGETNPSQGDLAADNQYSRRQYPSSASSRTRQPSPASTYPRQPRPSSQNSHGHSHGYGRSHGKLTREMSSKQQRQREELAAALAKYTRGSDRRQVLRTLGDPSKFSTCHVLPPVRVEDIAEAEREAAAERGVLNGVKFLRVADDYSPSGDGEDRVAVGGANANYGPQNSDSYFLQTLRETCTHMCDMDGVYADPMALYGGLLLRLSRSTGERDALEALSFSLGGGISGSELLVLPLVRRHHQQLLQYQQQLLGRPYNIQQQQQYNQQLQQQQQKQKPKVAQPLEVELFVESCNVHAKVSMTHEFGLYRRMDLEAYGMRTMASPSSSSSSLLALFYQNQFALRTMKPWVFLDAEVVERINFGTGASVRSLYVKIPDWKNGGYVAVGTSAAKK
mmetsp:Transcript_534/g.1095  ORF Transcript_534/g.1095 Transcript_534/m.1095 type:complete len:436 (-) Transcript_534:159-1466(-)|eukprot:CAMPEP_0171340300 /NCGR_PEP_ID=MMETSP0878-20121228/8479_1 /TAXON_ID=67004 /ORGANISM="Thalassiosira weissflogii, Strain CCMP1336" /LENGTH=435 /DNA_ID=CAMNT_0011842349 /DNA_START=132 /DNA_END=1439 /DNA_ORIENTATION=-